MKTHLEESSECEPNWLIIYILHVYIDNKENRSRYSDWLQAGQPRGSEFVSW
jgi:hypothetical protein